MPEVTARDWAIVFSRGGERFARMAYETCKLSYPDMDMPLWEDIKKELRDIK